MIHEYDSKVKPIMKAISSEMNSVEQSNYIDFEFKTKQLKSLENNCGKVQQFETTGIFHSNIFHSFHNSNFWNNF